MHRAIRIRHSPAGPAESRLPTNLINLFSSMTIGLNAIDALDSSSIFLQSFLQFGVVASHRASEPDQPRFLGQLLLTEARLFAESHSGPQILAALGIEGAAANHALRPARVRVSKRTSRIGPIGVLDPLAGIPHQV